MLNRFLFWILLFLGSISSLQAQYYSTGQDPASVRWSQIKADSFRIVFPDNYISHSQYLANILELTTRYETKSLKAKVPRMPFLLHTSSTLSNGLTVWAPRRIELYTCPPQDIYPEEWLEQLALHEYRHAVQTSKMNQGFTKALYYILGEQATGAVLGLYIPRWFLEGDATVTETALSNSGRGRVASFTAPLRAQFLQKGIYSFDLATMGSYKTFTPDAYALGYHLVAKGRERYGYELWDHTLNKVAKLPFMVVPFNAGIRQKTGLWKTELYRKMMAELLIEWQRQENLSWRSSYWSATKPNPSDYTTWNRPQFISDSTLIVARWSNEKVPRLICLNRNGKEKSLTQLGAYQSGSLSVAGNTAIWIETLPDIRWENRSFSIIRKRTNGQVKDEGQNTEMQLSDIRNPKSRSTAPRHHITTNLTRKSRYFSPALSADGSRILAVRITENNDSFIDILDAGDGSVTDSIPAMDDGLFLQPEWSADGTKIAFILLTQEGKSLHILNLESRSSTTLVVPSFTEISGPPLFFQRYILFSADYTGIENIFAIDTLTRQLFQVTSARFQATNPATSPDGNTLVYSDYNADGMMVVTRDADPSLWIPMDSIPRYTFPLAEAMAEQEGVNIQDSMRVKYEVRSTKDDSSLTTAPYHHITISPYRKAAHLFDLHSWAPLSIDADNLTLKPGVSVLSQNLLSTTFAGAGYEYDLSERTGKFYLNFSYQGWFPVIDVNYSFGKRAGIGRYSNTGETFRYTWNESNLQATVSVPLNLSRGIWYRKIQPSVGTSWIYVIHDKNTPEQFTKGSVNTLDYRLYMYNYIRSNYQDMFPKWGQTLDIGFRHTPFPGNDMGSVFGASGNLYFPGIFRHHGIRLYGGYQRRWDNLVYGYQFSNFVTLPRGTEVIYPAELISLSANYKFPFLRLDASVGSVLYIKRFKLNIFYDWAEGRGVHGDQTEQSTGFELTSELHVLRFVAPFELGVQGIYLPDVGKWTWRFLWGVSF
ncbi:hypothetical protein ACFLS7_01285 [Bacteroidota bacterium]